MFNRRIASLSQGFNQIRLVFDRYIDGSLKSRTRHKRTGGDEVRYHISDETNIENIPLKKLLSHISTKQDLTEYLAKRNIAFLKDRNSNFTVTYDTTTERYINATSGENTRHDHEEADTLLIIQSIDVAKDDPFTECVIFSPDTDVFLLLIHYFNDLPQVNIIL